MIPLSKWVCPKMKNATSASSKIAIGLHGIETNSVQMGLSRKMKKTKTKHMTMNTTIQGENDDRLPPGIMKPLHVWSFSNETKRVQWERNSERKITNKHGPKKRQCSGLQNHFDGWFDCQKRQKWLAQVLNCKLW